MDLLKDRLMKLDKRIEELEHAVRNAPLAKVPSTSALAISELGRLRKERHYLKASIASKRSTFRKNRSVLKRYR